MLTYKTLFAEKRIPAELNFDDIKVEKNIKHRFNEYDLNIFKFDSLFSLINVGDKFFGFLDLSMGNTGSLPGCSYHRGLAHYFEQNRAYKSFCRNNVRSITEINY